MDCSGGSGGVKPDGRNRAGGKYRRHSNIESAASGCGDLASRVRVCFMVIGQQARLHDLAACDEIRDLRNVVSRAWHVIQRPFDELRLFAGVWVAVRLVPSVVGLELLLSPVPAAALTPNSTRVNGQLS
jgi:hypothetical protein